MKNYLVVDMVSDYKKFMDYKDIKDLLLEELEILTFEYNDDDEYDYEDLKKRIYNIQDEIKSVTDYWEI